MEKNIANYEIKGDKIIVYFLNGEEYETSFSKDKEQKLINLANVDKCYQTIIDKEEKFKSFTNYLNCGRTFIIDSSLIYLLVNNNLSGALFFLLSIASVTACVKGNFANDDEFNEKRLRLQNRYFYSENKTMEDYQRVKTRK